MSNHTPGPWTRIGNSVGVANFEIATVWDVGLHNQLSNALLIAAAPELLDALKTLIKVTAHLDPCQATLEKARAAIAKATGESK